MSDFYDPELELLGGDSPEDDATGSAHAFKTAPIFTGDALVSLGPTMLPQRALYGRVIAQRAPNLPVYTSNPKLYINTNAPFSALVCGVQGSGKSHSTSVLLESCLMSDPRLGTLPEPLSALVFHFDTAAGGGCVQPCEAAYLSSLDADRGGRAVPPSVTVLVLPSNLEAMRRVYAGLPAVKVEPLHFSPEDINGERLLAMMKVEEGGQMPLYMEAIMSILRSMEGNFDYASFRQTLQEQEFNPRQKAMMNLRLSLLDACLHGGNSTNRVSTHFRKGHLTIIDLSSVFMDGSSACGFFDLILGLFIEADVKASGKVVVLDEAHKYLSDAQSGTSSRLTDSLLSVIRQQRHLATRVIISTQEPTVVPSKFLDLCSFIIAHRFSSPKWLRLLANHVSAADDCFDELFAKIVSLRTGQAVLFAASGLGVRDSGAAHGYADSDSGVGASEAGAAVVPIGQGYLHVQSRLRVTRDGGHSILAVQDPVHNTRFGTRVPGGAARGGAETPGGSVHGDEDEWASPAGSVFGSADESSGRPADAAASTGDGQEDRAEAWGPSTGTSASSAEKSGHSSSTSSASLAVILREVPQVPAVVVPRPQPSPAPTRTTSPTPPLPTFRAITTAAEPAPSKPQPNEPKVISLTGKLSKFQPVVELLQKEHHRALRYAMASEVQKCYEQSPGGSAAGFPQFLDDAFALGILEPAGHLGGNPLLRLAPGVAFAGVSAAPPADAQPPAPAAASASVLPAGTTSTVRVAGEKARYAPLVRYLLELRSQGSQACAINVTTIRRQFRHEDIDDIISGALSLGIVQEVPNASKRKLSLTPKVQFAFE